MMHANPMHVLDAPGPGEMSRGNICLDTQSIVSTLDHYVKSYDPHSYYPRGWYIDFMVNFFSRPIGPYVSPK